MFTQMACDNAEMLQRVVETKLLAGHGEHDLCTVM